MFFLLWRELRGKITTNKKITSFGQDPHECYSSYTPGLDSIDHIFVNGHFAVNVWKFFAVAYGIDQSNLPLPHYIMRWWSFKYKNEAHKLLLHVIPIFV